MQSAIGMDFHPCGRPAVAPPLVWNRHLKVEMDLRRTGAAHLLWSAWIVCFACVSLSTQQPSLPQRPPAKPPTVPATVRLLDTATCTGQHGPYVHAWVTVRDVAARRDEDGSWHDLTPALQRQPLQLDLLTGKSGSAELGSTAQLPVGHYSQIRVALATPEANPQRLCTAVAPCVVLQTGGVVPLLLSPESEAGVVLSSGQIAGGTWTVAPHRPASLTLLWDACASILPESNGQFRLAPVLRAMAAMPATTSITGRVINADGDPIVGGNVMLALEMPDSRNIARPVLMTNAEANGQFQFPAVPQPVQGSVSAGSTWDLVIAAIDGFNRAYAPVIVTGVPAGAEIGDIRLSPLPPRNTAPASLFGEVRDAGASETQPSAVTASALLPGAGGAFTSPLMQQGQAVATILVAPNPLACPPNIACGRYTLAVPAQSAQIGQWNPMLSRITWLQEPTATATYQVEISRPACPTAATFDREATPGSLQQLPTVEFAACR